MKMPLVIYMHGCAGLTGNEREDILILSRIDDVQIHQLILSLTRPLSVYGLFLSMKGGF